MTFQDKIRNATFVNEARLLAHNKDRVQEIYKMTWKQKQTIS